jgi:hypothetical protein
MREKLNSLGVPPEYHAHAKHFVGEANRTARRVGHWRVK